MPNSKVAIIGAGPSGLVVAKECLEIGLEPVIFEKYSSKGGVWNSSGGSVWNSMKANLSQYHMGFSDFLWSHQTPDFPSNTEVATYLEDYALENNLDRLINYDTEVVNADFNTSNKKWTVQLKNLGINEFDKIIFASGIFSKPFIPYLKGANSFKGTILHSKDYKNPLAFANKKVVVVGGSFSGYEIASNIAKYGNHVSHVVSKSAWIANRYYKKGHSLIPLDIISYSHRNTPELDTEEQKAKKKIAFFESTFGNPGDVNPMLKVVEDENNPAPVVVSDSYIKYVGKKHISPYVGSLTLYRNQSCILSNGEELAADIVILCTGYLSDLPIKNPQLKKIVQYDKTDLFQPLILNKSTLHPQLPQAAFIGLYRGPFFGVLELQARWIAGLFSENLKYPSIVDSKSALEYELLLRNKNPRPQFPRGNYVEFMYDLSKEIGAYPIDLMEEAKGEIDTPMIPADFRRFGFNSKYDIAITQRARLMNRMKL